MKNLTTNQKKLLLIFLVVFIILGSLTFITTDYYFMSPGPPYQWDIDYGDVEFYDFDGNLFQLTVRRDEASALIYLWSYVDNSFDLYPREVILPKGVTPKELSEISIQNMKTSENVAIAVALKKLNYGKYEIISPKPCYNVLNNYFIFEKGAHNSIGKLVK